MYSGTAASLLEQAKIGNLGSNFNLSYFGLSLACLSTKPRHVCPCSHWLKHLRVSTARGRLDIKSETDTMCKVQGLTNFVGHVSAFNEVLMALMRSFSHSPSGGAPTKKRTSLGVVIAPCELPLLVFVSFESL